MATDLRQTHFRFGKDDGTEASHTFWQLEDVNHSQFITADWTFLLRFTEQEAGGTAAANTDAQFQYNKNGAGWVDITTTSSVVKAVAVAAFTNGQACTQRLSGTGTFEVSGAGCTEDGSSGGPANDIAASGNSETECALQVIGADVSNNDTIQFRFTSPDWTVGYDITPTLTVIESAPVVVIPGIGALTTTLFTPSVILGLHVIPGNAALVLTAFTPTIVVAGDATVIPGVATLTLTAFAPTVYTPRVAIPGALTLGLTTFITTVTITNNVLVTPGIATLTLTAFTPDIIQFSTYAAPFLFTAANYGTVSVYVEVYIRAISGTAYARLYNETATAVVANSTVSTASSTFQRLRSSAITLVDGNSYRIQLGKSGSGEALAGALILVNS